MALSHSQIQSTLKSSFLKPYFEAIKATLRAETFPSCAAGGAVAAVQGHVPVVMPGHQHAAPPPARQQAAFTLGGPHHHGGPPRGAATAQLPHTHTAALAEAHHAAASVGVDFAQPVEDRKRFRNTQQHNIYYVDWAILIWLFS